MRPGSFGMLAQAIAMRDEDEGELPLPATAYEPDPSTWRDLRWYDRRNGEPIEVTWLQPGTDPEGFARAMARGAVPVRTLGQILTRYLDQPEHKSLAPDGSLSTGTTAGLLLRRPVVSAPALTDLTGKEGTKLIERATGEITDPSEYRVRYGERVDRWTALVVPVIRQMGVEEGPVGGDRRRSKRSRAVLAPASISEPRLGTCVTDRPASFLRTISPRSTAGCASKRLMAPLRANGVVVRCRQDHVLMPGIAPTLIVRRRGGRAPFRHGLPRRRRRSP